jgi:hypothetical protein
MKIFTVLFLFVTTILNCQELSTITIRNYEKIYNNGRLKTIIYYIPFSVLTRSALNIDSVKEIYHIKIESRNNSGIYNFLKEIENTQHNIISGNNFDLRCVIEFYYDDILFFSYGLDGFCIIIDEKRIEYDIRFYNFVLQYLPKIYEEGFTHYIH